MAERLVHTGYGNGRSDFPIKLYVTYSSSQDIASNTSTITCGMYVTTPGSGWTIGTWTDFNGSYVGTSSNTFNGTIPNFGGKRTLTSGQTFKVNHNSDGTGSATIYWKWGVNSSWGRTQNVSGSFTISLPQIPRQANLTAAPNFNDEQNPTITYSNPAGNAVTSLDACISFTGSKDDIAYRAISKTGSSYTFSLTEAERNVLRNATTGSNSRNVIFYVRTVIGSNTFYSTITKTLSIVNANPSLSPTVVDSNATTKALTGDANKLVKYYSNAQYSIGAGARKGASLSSQKVVHNGSTKTSATGTYNGVENGSFYFEAKDSRGNTSSTTINKTFINYVRLTSNFKVRIDVSGKATFNITGNYFNGSFGATANTLTVQYRYKAEGGSYSSWTNATATKSGNTYTAKPTITGLNYQKAYTFQVRAIDKLATVTTGEITTKALPVFDWGKNDFHVHGNLIVEGSITGNNAIAGAEISGEELLFDGSSDGTITLPVSTANYKYLEVFYEDNNGRGSGYTKVYQPNGAVLQLGLQETGDTVYLRQTGYQISGNTITPDLTTATYLRYEIAKSTWGSSKGTNYIRITRVVGYR